MKEIWREVPGFDGKYQVSNFGNVKSFWRGKPRILKPCLMHGEYLSIALVSDGKIHRLSIGKLVANAFIPNPDNKPNVRHKDGNPRNNHVDNLYWTSGSPHIVFAHSKLTATDVEWIRNNYIFGDKNFGLKAMAAKFNVSTAVIGKAVKFKTFRNIPGKKSTDLKARKLTGDQIKYIRENYIRQSKERGSVALGKKFGVTPAIILGIVNGKFYRDV